MDPVINVSVERDIDNNDEPTFIIAVGDVEAGLTLIEAEDLLEEITILVDRMHNEEFYEG